MIFKTIARFTTIAVILAALLSGVSSSPGEAGEVVQQPTVAIATVTGTPSGPTITVNPDQEQINVRAGPGTEFAKVGVLVAGQTVDAMGRSTGGLWIQIRYVGAPGGVAWVYASLVSIPTGNLPIIEPPPSPTPRVTPTIDPTLAAQFIVVLPPTRLPTFTPPAPLVIPTFEASTPITNPTGLPVGLLIIGLGVLGLFGGVISFLRGR